jgi:hypothetical protein
MENSPQSPDGETKPTLPLQWQWLPTMEAMPGMVIARPVVGLSGVHETMYLAVGSAITAETIEQLVVKGVECIAVVQDKAIDVLIQAESVRQRESRLLEIFGAEPTEACRELMDALRAAGTTLC